jgi:hypothetical protein
MKKHAFAMAAALALVLAVGSAHAAGKAGEANGPFGSAADHLGTIPIEQTSLDRAAAEIFEGRAGARNMLEGQEEFAAISRPTNPPRSRR